MPGYVLIEKRFSVDFCGTVRHHADFVDIAVYLELNNKCIYQLILIHYVQYIEGILPT